MKDVAEFLKRIETFSSEITEALGKAAQALREADSFEFPEFPEFPDVFKDMPFYTVDGSDEFSPVEYKVIETHELTKEYHELEEALNALGAEGWELVVWDGSRAIFTRS